MTTIGPNKRKRRNEAIVREIPISKLVPSEPRLDRSSIDKVKSLISSGSSVPPPRVIQIGDAYYVRDGNHRVMAMKELGHENIECSVQHHRPRPNVSDFDSDDFQKAISLGYRGFNNLSIGSAKDKEKGYEEEDDLLSLMDSSRIQGPARSHRKRTASQRPASRKRTKQHPGLMVGHFETIPPSRCLLPHTSTAAALSLARINGCALKHPTSEGNLGICDS